MPSYRGDQLNVIGPSMLISSRANKTSDGTLPADGIDGPVMDELELEMSDRELLDLSDKWEGQYKQYYGKIEPKQKTNRLYYRGMQGQSEAIADGSPVPDNFIFEATETFLAQALARNPDPIVFADNSDAGNEESRVVRTMLQTLAESLVLRQKMKMMVRLWNVDYIGVLKHGYDSTIQDITTEVRNSRNFLFDPAGFVDEYGNFVGWLGERITAPASILAEMCPDKEQFISEMVEYKMGTSITWTEWWTDEYTFTTFKGNVIDKSRNPHFNYPATMPEFKGDQVTEVLREGKNHFARPMKPYTFLSVFSFQEQPHDVTTLIEQNRRNQDYIVERSKQVARALKKSNNSEIFNLGAGYDAQKAKQALDAIEDGTGALEPVANAVRRLEASGIPEIFLNDLDARVERLRSIYGTLGSTAVQQNQDTTARGMILNEQRSADRIGGTIGDSLNQVASNVFNYWVQLMHVYYTTEHKGSIMGKLQAVEEAVLTAEGLTRRLVVSAAPDSMTPKDPITEANQSLELYQAGLPIDPKSVLTLMDVPDVESTIEGGMLYQLNKQAYIAANFPDLAQLLGLGQPAPAASPPQGSPAGPILSPMQPPELSAPPNNPDLSQVPLPNQQLPK